MYFYVPTFTQYHIEYRHKRWSVFGYITDEKSTISAHRYGFPSKIRRGEQVGVLL